MLKKSFFIFHIVFLSLASLLLAESRTTTLTATRVYGISQWNTPSSISYNWGSDDLGSYYSGDNQTYYRSVWSFNLSALANATSINNVTVNISTTTSGSSTYTAHILDGLNSSLPGYVWQDIDNGTSTELNLTYGTHNNVSFSSLSGQLLSYITDGTLYIGLLNLTFNQPDYTNVNSFQLIISYNIPDGPKSFQVRNEIPTYGGTIGVGISSSPSERQSPYYSQILNTQTANLEAYDNQIVSNQEYVFNDTEAPLNKSDWQKGLSIASFAEFSNSQTTSLSGSDIPANTIISAILSKVFNHSTNYYTEFDNTLNNQSLTKIVDLNYGSITTPATLNIGNNQYSFSIWADNFSLNNTRSIYSNMSNSYTALYKYKNHSNSSSAFLKNSERKVIKSVGDVDALHKVYESMGHVWYERSTDNGTTWTIMNSGKPLDDFQGKNPSIDYYPNYEKVVVAFQNEDVNTGEAQIKVVNFIMGAKVGESYPVTSYLHAYADVNFTPVVAHTVSENICVLYDDDNSEGLFYIIGTINYTNGTVSWGTAQQVPNTTIYDQNPAISGAKGSQIYHFAWQTNDTAIKYQKYYKSGTQWILGTQLTPSSGSGYPKNYNPSITDLNGGARMCWVGEDVGGIISDANVSSIGEGENTLLKTNTTIIKSVIFKNPDYYRFWNFGSNVQAPTIAKSDDNLAYIIGWNETNTNSNKFVDNLLSDIKNFATTGNYVQVSNAPTKQEMLGIVFNTAASPYAFNKTNNIGTYYAKEGNIGLSVNYGRQGLVGKDSLQFYFAIGDIIKDQQHIKFINLPEEYEVNSLEALNYSLVSEPFVINDGESFIYSVQYGMVGNQYAQLANGKQVNFKVKLIDANTGELLRVFDNVTYSGSNLQNYNNILYQVSVNEIGSKTVKMCLEVNDNLNGFYTVTDKMNDEDVLAKLNFKDVNLVENIEVTSYDLFQNYPNPFNPSTTISYQVPDNCRVTLKVFDVLGKEVTTLVDEYKSKGKYDVQFNAKHLASGMYIYQIKAGDFVSSKKLMLMK